MLLSAFQLSWSSAVLTSITSEMYKEGLHMHVLLMCNHAVIAVQEIWDIMIFLSLNAGD